jgi:FkbM family methyltransferase
MALWNEVFTEDVYGQHGLSYPEGACIFDVGANVGFFSLFASLACKPARILAFEPIPANFELLQTNLALNGAPVQALNLGVGDRAGEDEFVFYPRQAGLSNRIRDREADRQSVLAIAGQGLRDEGFADLPESELQAAVDASLRSETFRCPIITVSEAIRLHQVDRIDLLKIDVEGSEADVLRGIADEDWPKIDQLAIEVHGPDLLREVLGHLERHGYSVSIDQRIAMEGASVSMVYARRPGLPADAPRFSRPQVSEIRAALGARLPAYMLPERYVFVDSLPRTPNGKLDRRALARRRDEGGGEREKPRVAPASELERQIAAVWQEVLRSAEALGTNENFFEVGGNSLLLVQVHRRLRESVGAVALVDLFQHPTIASLAERIESGEDRLSLAKSAARVERQRSAMQQSEALARQRSFMEQRRARPRQGNDEL